MKLLKKSNLLFVFLFIVILIASILPVIISKDAAITEYSFISIAFAVCSVIHATLAFAFKNKGNLFIKGKYWFYRLLDYSFSEDKTYTKSEDYKKEFALSAFIFCATIPPYISFAFFANGFYSELLKVIWWTILRGLAIILVVLVPPVIKNIQAKKQQRLKDEAEMKKQESRESMGKWK